MAYQSICPRCGHSGFELVEESPKGSQYKMSFTRCASCGAVVGVTEYFNVGFLLRKLAKKLNIDLDSNY